MTVQEMIDMVKYLDYINEDLDDMFDSTQGCIRTMYLLLLKDEMENCNG